MAYWSFHHVSLDELRRHPDIALVRTATNDIAGTIHFTVVFDWSDKSLPEQQVRLAPCDEDGTLLADNLAKGQPILAGLGRETAERWGLAKLSKEGTARVYRFQVKTKLLNSSSLSWWFGSSYDDTGIPIGVSGVMESCDLVTLAEAAKHWPDESARSAK